MTDFGKTDLGIDLIANAFRYKTQNYFPYFLHLFSVPPFIFWKNGGGILLLEHVYRSIKTESLYLKIVMLTSPGFFLAHLSTECSVSYCDHFLSVCVRLSDVRPSVHNFLVNTLASTNINQSAPNLFKMYMTIRSRMSFTTELNGLELSKLSALELENLPYLTLLTL